VEEGILLSKELSVRLTPETLTAARTATGLRTAGIVLAGSAFVAVCAHVVLPLNFTPVPLNLQTFAVLVLGLMLSPRLAAGTLAAYLAEGALGLPVFSPVPAIPGGLAHLLGPTGGYLLAYPAAVAMISWLVRNTGPSRNTGERRFSRGFTCAAGSAAAGTVFILGCGALWLAVLTHASAQAILTLGVVPFLPGEALKIAAAAGVALGYRRLRRQAD
jgi:biotin transport system substrate-specific component